jgi:exopolyphosphatase/guanosine-5'-triphosphate,3'-diphosphate pyrophosphatase
MSLNEKNAIRTDPFSKSRMANGDVSELSAAVTAIIQTNHADINHATPVTYLSARLFDAIAAIHKMDRRERLLLEIAAMLHDIGWSRTTNGGHHKHSRDMILEAAIPGIARKERNVCSLIARYHNKSEPDPARHRGFSELRSIEKTTVSWCAAILRVADGLDCNHNCMVHISNCHIDKARITILLAPGYDSAAEVRGACRKGGLLETMTGRELVILQCV